MTERGFLKRMLAAVAVAASGWTLEARTVAWYHLDEVAPGTRLTASTAILNAVDSTKLRGTPYVSTTRTAAASVSARRPCREASRAGSTR